MTENPELNSFEASVMLRKAISMQKIDIKGDPLYKDLELATWETEMTKYASIGIGTTTNLLILYSNKFKFLKPWPIILTKLIGVTAVCSFFYLTSPGVKRHNQLLIDISKNHKQELHEIFQHKTNS